ncbi:DNA polymerase [Bosea sp. LjRoot237]|uniref:DNA polymerase n=1 Tax=Bosea sp. LjRoot237 TaxID=3342292 RepID=UPI003ECED6C1
MIENASKLLIFIKDFTGRGADRFFWLEGDQLNETSAEEVVGFPGAIVCHDFWIIRDIIFDKTQNLPKTIIDLDEFRIAISGNPEDRLSREKLDITAELERFGVGSDICSAYKRMFNRGIEFDTAIACEAAKAMAQMYSTLCTEASEKGELERFMDVEVPVYGILQKAMSAGITINSEGLSEKRREAEYDYFFSLKNYSDKHDMPLETPTRAAIQERLDEAGFDLNGVSTEYVLEFLPHQGDFGNDTLTLWDFDTAKRVLSSLTLSSRLARPIIDIFGSRTSRIHLRSPLLQNMPKKYRTIVSARDGASLCYVDFDQYEVGIMAALSEDPELATLYGAGDMYDLFATTHLGLAGNRKAAKQLFLSYAYGMSRKSLIDAAVSLGANREQAKSAFRLFSKYEEWKKTVWSRFKKEGRVATTQGNHYKRIETGPLSAKEQRSAISQVVQGTASLIFKKALLKVNDLDDVTIVLPMHDALLFEHRLAGTPAKVVSAFENAMTAQLQGLVKGKASIGQFAPS